MVKNYGIHDEWKDLDKVNDIDIKSVDGVIDSIKVNGEEAGGGEVNLANVVITNTKTEEVTIYLATFVDGYVKGELYPPADPGTHNYQTPVLGNGSEIFIEGKGLTITTTGDITEAGPDSVPGTYYITGDCAITISEEG